MLIDLHVQTRTSRHGKLDPDDIIQRAKTIGLDGICFTEDQPIGNWDELAALGRDHEFAVFVGRSLFTEEGHLLFYPRKVEHITTAGNFPYNVNDDKPIPFEEVRQKAEKLGGVLAAAHPYHLRVELPMGDKLFDLEGLGALEVRNGACKPLINDFALEASFHLKLPGIGGSQTLDTLDTLGAGVSLFCYEVANQEDLVDALHDGLVWPAQLSDKVEFRPRPTSRDDRRGGGGRSSGGRGGDRRRGRR